MGRVEEEDKRGRKKRERRREREEVWKNEKRRGLSQQPHSSCTFLAIEHSLVLLFLHITCHGNRLHHKTKE